MPSCEAGWNAGQSQSLTEIQKNNYNTWVDSKEVGLVIVWRRVISAAVGEPVGLKAYCCIVV